MTDHQSAVSPDAFAMYLASRRWTPVATWRGTTVWEQSGLGSGQLLLPIEPENETGRNLIARAVQQLAKLEKRSVDRLLADLCEPQADTQRFRLLPSTPSGTIPITHARKAIEAIYGVLRDASRSIHEGPSLYHQDKPEEPVKELLTRVHLCLTEPGSYVFATKILDLDDTLLQESEGLFDLCELNLPRLSGHQVSRSVQESVAKAHAVAETLVEDGRIDNPTEQGISSNLCEALADLSGEDRSRSFEISFEWGLSQGQSLPKDPLHFTEEMAVELQKFGSHLRRLARIGQVIVEGRVDGLQIEDPGRKHRIHIKGTAQRGGNREAFKIWAFVSEEDYDRAFRAHRENRQVRIEGEIRDERGGLRLHSKPGNFRILNSW